jgi:F0F1-type ATP synthase membrane subunit b/b'
MELARSEAERIKDEAKKFAKAKLDEVEKTIKMKGEEMKRELEIYALQLAVNLAAEKIKRVKTKEDEKKLFSALLDKIEKMRN